MESLSSADSPTPIPENIGGIAYGVMFSIGVLSVVLVITLTSYLCTSRIGLPTISNPSQQNITAIDHHDHHDHEQSAMNEQGIDEATLASYPKLLYSQLVKQLDDDDDDEENGSTASNNSCCSICLGDYKERDLLLLLPHCGHLFHVKCITQWLLVNLTCPICRSSPTNINNSTSLIPILQITSFVN